MLRINKLFFYLLILGNLCIFINNIPTQMNILPNQKTKNKGSNFPQIISLSQDNVQSKNEIKVKLSKVIYIVNHEKKNHEYIIKGKQFGPDYTVLINGNKCETNFISENKIRCLLDSIQNSEKINLEIHSKNSKVLLNTQTKVIDYELWSQEKTWISNKTPKEGEDVFIPSYKRVLVDVSTPKLKNVTIEGKLSFEDKKDITFDADSIILNKGSLLIGDENDLFQNNLKITLHLENPKKIGENGIICNECKISIAAKIKKLTRKFRNLKLSKRTTVSNKKPKFHFQKPKVISSEKNVLFSKAIQKNQLNPELSISQTLENNNCNKKKFSNYFQSNIQIIQKLQKSSRPASIYLKNVDIKKIKINNICIDLIEQCKKTPSKFLFNPLMSKFHLSQARILTTTNKTWDVSADWSPNSVPDGNESEVVIESDWNMKLNTNTAVIQHLKIFGRLYFDDSVSNLTLNAKIIEIMEGGELSIGTANQKYSQNAKIILHGLQNDSPVTVGGNIGPVNNAIINKGKFFIYAEHNRSNKEYLASPISPSVSSINIFSSSSNWQNGDHIVISSSTKISEGYDSKIIQGISGVDITLDSLTGYYHNSVPDFLTFQTLQGKIIMYGETINLTRNFVIQAKDGSSWGCTIINPGFTSTDDNTTWIQGEIVLDGVQIKNCGQGSDLSPAILIKDNIEKNSVENKITNSAFTNLLGSAIDISNSVKFEVSKSNFFDSMDFAINLTQSLKITIDKNNIIGVRSGTSTLTADQLRVNYGIKVSNHLPLDKALIEISSNYVSSIEDFGIGYFTPGYTCEQEITSTSSYMFYENTAHSCDVGWFGTDAVNESCLNFAKFYGYKNRSLGFAYVGESQGITFHDSILSDNTNAVSVIVASDNTDNDPSVLIRDVSIISRSSRFSVLLYNTDLDCENNGVQLSTFSHGKFDYNFLNSNLPLYKSINPRTKYGRQYFENVSFINFSLTSCKFGNSSVQSYPVIVNNYNNGMPTALLTRGTKLLLTDPSPTAFVKFEPTNVNFELSSPCASTTSPCTGAFNSVIYDILISSFDYGLQNTYFNNLTMTLDDPDCEKVPSDNHVKCTDTIGNVIINGGSQVNNGDLFPATLTVRNPETNSEIFSHVMIGETDAGGVLKLKEINELEFPTNLSKDITLRLETYNDFNWAVLQVKIDPSLSVGVYDKNGKIKRIIPKKEEVDEMLPSECGQNVVKLDNSSINIWLDGADECKVDVKFAKAFASSIKMDKLVDDFLDDGGIDTVETFIYTALGIQADTNRVIISLVKGDPTLVYFEIEADQASANVEQDLRGLYCTLNTEIAKTNKISGIDVIAGLGVPNLLIGGGTPTPFFESCNINPHDDILCLQFEANQTDCKTCRFNYNLDPSSLKCFPLYCKIINSVTNQCDECISGYWVDQAVSNTCKQIVPIDFCEEYKKNANECDVCEPGRFFLNGACTTIVNQINNCKYYASDGICSECETRYYLEDNKCISHSDNLLCATFHKTENKCLSCEFQYVLKNHKCVDVSKCSTVDQNQNCTACYSGFYLDNSTKTCLPRTVANCATPVTTEDRCQTCDDYFWLDSSNGTCHLIEGCKIFAANRGSCDECFDTHIRHSTNPICILRTAEFCETINPTLDQCLTCKENYYLRSSDKTCQAVTPVANCIVYESDSDACKFCESPTYFNGSSCVVLSTQIANCIYYNQQQQCVQCKDGHYSANGTSCVAGELAGCVVYDSELVCKTCDTQYFLKLNINCQLYSNDLKCSKFNPTEDQCLTCPYFHRLSAEKKCEYLVGCKELEPLNPSDCKICQSDYYLDDTTKTCKVRTAQHCDEHDPSNDQCLSCLQNFWKDVNDSNICKPVTVVTGCVTYALTSNECVSCVSSRFLNTSTKLCEELTSSVDNCLIYEGNGQCKTCEEDYELKSPTECVLGNIPGCRLYKTAGECMTCHDGYYLKSDTECRTYSLDLNCNTFNPNEDECVDCSAKYTFNNATKKCDPVIGCEEYSEDDTKCIKCEPDYYLNLSNNICYLRTQKNCDGFKENKDECENCQHGFYKDQNDSNICKRTTFVQQCTQYSPTSNSCNTCDNTSYLNGNDCQTVAVLVSNCREYKANQECESCEDEHFLDNGNCEPGSILNCKVYASETNCTACNEGSYISSGNGCLEYSSDLFCKEFEPDQDKCKSCNEKYQMTSEGKCERIENCEKFTSDFHGCQECQADYFLSTSTNKCTERQNKTCKTFFTNLDYCETCTIHEYLDSADSFRCKVRSLDNQHCEQTDPNNDKCLQCSNNWINADGVCLDPDFLIRNCRYYNVDTTCRECSDGYDLVDEKCIHENCLETDESQKCTKCREGYFLGNPTDSNAQTTDKICIMYSIHNNCSELESASDKCKVCSTGYELDPSNTCQLHNCREFDQGQNCALCNTGFALHKSSNECVQRTDNKCKILNADKITCQVCHENYYLNQSGGSVCFNVSDVANCETYTENLNICQSCENGYVLFNNVCHEEIDNCLEYDSDGDCSTCRGSYIPKDSVCIHQKYQIYEILMYLFLALFILFLILTIILIFLNKKYVSKSRSKPQSESLTNVMVSPNKKSRIESFDVSPVKNIFEYSNWSEKSKYLPKYMSRQTNEPSKNDYQLRFGRPNNQNPKKMGMNPISTKEVMFIKSGLGTNET